MIRVGRIVYIGDPTLEQHGSPVLVRNYDPATAVYTVEDDETGAVLELREIQLSELPTVAERIHGEAKQEPATADPLRSAIPVTQVPECPPAPADKHRPRLMLMGHGQHGKDTAAEYLRDNYGYTFSSSSWAMAEEIYPFLKDRYGYADVEACFNDRYNHREEWYLLIKFLTHQDPAMLARKIFQRSSIYVGIRDTAQLIASRDLFDLCIWVDASERVSPEDPGSINVHKGLADIIVENNGTLLEFYARLDNLMRVMGVKRVGG